MGQIIFVTGTDTGAGKTLLTALLLVHLRRNSCHALGIKPFCSGDRGDVRLLAAAQDHEIDANTINPFYYSDPVAPLVAARKAGTLATLPDVLKRIGKVAQQCEILLVEGAGGLLVPLGNDFGIADLIVKLSCRVLVVGRNKLGVVNHTLLTVEVLDRLRVQRKKIVLMGTARSNLATRTNEQLIAEIAAPHEVHAIPFLGSEAHQMKAVKRNAKICEKTLARILKEDTFSVP